MYTLHGQIMLLCSPEGKYAKHFAGFVPQLYESGKINQILTWSLLQDIESLQHTMAKVHF